MRPAERKGLWRMLAILAVLALIATACDSGDSVEVDDAVTTTTAAPADGDTATTAAPDDPTETTSAEAGEAVLIAAQGAEPDRLDPHLTSAYASFQVLENVYDTLVQPGADLSMEPALAESWEISDDNLTWTFTLRDDVVFHNGRAFTADDVVYSYNRILDPEVRCHSRNGVDQARQGDNRVARQEWASRMSERRGG